MTNGIKEKDIRDMQDSAPQIKDEHIVARKYISTLDNYC